MRCNMIGKDIGDTAMNLEIREYVKQDWINLLSISDDKWAQSIRPLCFSLMREYDGKVLKTLLALCDGTLVGFIYGFVLPNKTLLPEFMYLKPEYRHQGIAQVLLEELEKQSGCTASMIFYHNSLHDFYQRQGYQSGDNLEVAMKEL